MSNLLQKIISRSEGFAAENKRSAPQILPDKPYFFNEKQTGFINEREPPTDLMNNRYTGNSVEPAPSKNTQNGAAVNANNPVQPKQEESNMSAQDSGQKNNTLLPFSETQSDFKKNELSHGNPSDHSGNGNKILPSATIIEKINQRNVQNPAFEKTGDEMNKIKFIPVLTDDQRNANIVTLHKESVYQEQGESKKAKRIEQDSAAASKRLQAEQPGQKVKEQLHPAQKDIFPDNTGKKTGQHNKLVIGRITVEVINPTPAPIKTQEPLMRQNNISKASNTVFTSINKLSFGLGQL